MWSGYCETFDRHILNLLCTHKKISVDRRYNCVRRQASRRWLQCDTRHDAAAERTISNSNGKSPDFELWVSERTRAIATRCFIKNNTVRVYALTYIYIRVLKRNAWWKKTRIGMFCVHACCVQDWGQERWKEIEKVTPNRKKKTNEKCNEREKWSVCSLE